MLLYGESFEITPNLWAALRRLRRSVYERIIWVDAVCINQDDLKEKSSQLALMGGVYSRADEVLIWLGDSISGDSSLKSSPGALEDGRDQKWIIENIEHVCRGLEFHDHECQALGAFALLYLLSIDGYWCNKAPFKTDGEGRCRLATEFTGAWQALRRLLQLPWWSRIWVVQEALLVETATMILGSTSVTWRLIPDFCRSYQTHLPDRACCHSSVTWSMPSYLWDDIILMRVTFWSFNGNGGILIQSPSNDYTGFWEFLWLSRHKRATNPRDKVYGLLGLFPLLEADYSMSVAETFSNCTEAFIRIKRNLHALVGPRLRRPGLPTWTIDLLPEDGSGINSYSHNVFRRSSSTTLFNACGNLKLHYSLDLGKLTLHGIHVNKVKTFAPCWHDETVAQSVDEWEALAFAANGNSTSLYPSGCTRADAFWRTIVRDAVRDGEKIRRANLADHPSYLHFRQWLRRPAHLMRTPTDTSFASYRRSFFNASLCQVFFVTYNGYIGLGEPLEVNDEVWLLAGGTVPFILRPCSQDSEHAGCYSLIGDCYVHGMMDGELMDGNGLYRCQEVVLV